MDKIIVIDDSSIDNTSKIVKEIAEEDRRVTLIQHKVNQRPVGAIVTGYKKAIKLEINLCQGVSDIWLWKT